MLTDEATRRLVIPNFLRIPKFIIIANIMGLLENWLTLLPGIFCPIKKDNKLSNIYYKNIAYSSMTVFLILKRLSVKTTSAIMTILRILVLSTFFYSFYPLLVRLGLLLRLLSTKWNFPRGATFSFV